MPNPQGKNGHTIALPDEAIRPLVEQFVASGYTNLEIISRLQARQLNISLSLLEKRRSQWGLKSSRGQAHSIESIRPAIERVRVRFPKQGSHDMKQTLLQEENIMVSRELILKYMNIHHPDEVQDRKRRRLKRSTYWTAGLHDSWVFDQHDKWRRFQLFLHVGIYNPEDALERLVFHFIFIPWLQCELNLFAERFNNAKPRYNMHKILPHGRPNDIFYHPEKFGSRDFSVKVDGPSLDLVRHTYAPSDHPVFLLVPREFSEQAYAFMSELGHTELTITRNNVWDVYADLLMCFQSIADQDHIRSVIIGQPAIPDDGEKPIGSEEMNVMDLPPYIEGPDEPGYGAPVDGSRVNSSDEESDFYEFVWTDEEED
ncbi:hypothetical protein EDB19DRAFT_1835564 [Suillus lakei]|nr:hypothetical protein EDB19DRAFT_1835564 [Suillus lakei]